MAKNTKTVNASEVEAIVAAHAKAVEAKVAEGGAVVLVSDYNRPAITPEIVAEVEKLATSYDAELAKAKAIIAKAGEDFFATLEAHKTKNEGGKALAQKFERAKVMRDGKEGEVALPCALEEVEVDGLYFGCVAVAPQNWEVAVGTRFAGGALKAKGGQGVQAIAQVLWEVARNSDKGAIEVLGHFAAPSSRGSGASAEKVTLTAKVAKAEAKANELEALGAELGNLALELATAKGERKQAIKDRIVTIQALFAKGSN